jgi:2-phosphosulfolactate phosphatase
VEALATVCGAGGGAMKLEVILEPSEIRGLAERDLSGATCVVFDVLRATSSMLTGLAHGVSGLVPVVTVEEAWLERERFPEALLGGERQGERIEGFDLGNSPFEYMGCSGRRIITTTTNGTVALRACGGARQVWVGAILNLEALRERLWREKPAEVLLVCAGTSETLALEDVWAAGRLLEGLKGGSGAEGGGWEWSDSAQVAWSVARAWPEAELALRASRNGRALLAKGRERELAWCARESALALVGEMSLGEVRSAILG